MNISSIEEEVLIYIICFQLIGLLIFLTINHAYYTSKQKKLIEQIQNLKTHLLADQQWMAHNRIALTLTNRYLTLLSPDWSSKNVLFSDKLRDILNMNPNKKTTYSFSYEHELEMIAEALDPHWKDRGLPLSSNWIIKEHLSKLQDRKNRIEELEKEIQSLKSKSINT